MKIFDLLSLLAVFDALLECLTFFIPGMIDVRCTNGLIDL